VSKVASHGPADVEADHHLPRRAGSGGQRGAPAGCGCELRNSGSLSAKAKRGETKYLKSAGLRVSGFSFSAISPKPSVCWQYPPETTSASWITAPFFLLAACCVSVRSGWERFRANSRIEPLWLPRQRSCGSPRS
jgi:hypothetical protein